MTRGPFSSLSGVRSHWGREQCEDSCGSGDLLQASAEALVVTQQVGCRDWHTRQQAPRTWGPSISWQTGSAWQEGRARTAGTEELMPQPGWAVPATWRDRLLVSSFQSRLRDERQKKSRPEDRGLA